MPPLLCRYTKRGRTLTRVQKLNPEPGYGFYSLSVCVCVCVCVCVLFSNWIAQTNPLLGYGFNFCTRVRVRGGQGGELDKIN